MTNPLNAVETAFKALSTRQPLNPVLITRAIIQCNELKESDPTNAKIYAEYAGKFEDLYLLDKMRYGYGNNI